MNDNLTAAGVREMESGNVPAKRDDLPGQHVEAVRFAIANNIRELIVDLNKKMKDAATCGLDVRIYQNNFSGGQVSVSIYENRKY